MKNLLKITTCVLLSLICVCFVACDNRTEKEKNFTYPTNEDVVYSNNGLAVQKGKYLYFVNGMVNIDSTTQNASYKKGALLLTKLDDDGNIVKDDDGYIKDEYFITMSSRLCGYEATDLMIAGDYLYFTSQCQESTIDATDHHKYVWAKEIVEFYRIKLDKTGKVERLYQTDSSYSNIEFKMYNNNGSAIILVKEGENNKLVKIGEIGLTVDGISSVTMPDDPTKVFYVKENKLFNLNLLTNETTEYCSHDTYSLTVKFAGKNNVYLTYSSNSSTVLAVCPYEGTKDLTPMCNYISNYDDVRLLPDRDVVMVVDKDNATIRFLKSGNEINTQYPLLDEKIVDADNKGINVIGFNNGCVVYYDSENNVKVVSYANCLDGQSVTIDTVAKVEYLQTTYFDISNDSDYMYFYCKNDTSYNLYRLKIANYNEEVAELITIK